MASSRQNCRLEIRLLERMCAEILLMSQQLLPLGKFVVGRKHIHILMSRSDYTIPSC